MSSQKFGKKVPYFTHTRTNFVNLDNEAENKLKWVSSINDIEKSICSYTSSKACAREQLFIVRLCKLPLRQKSVRDYSISDKVKSKRSTDFNFSTIGKLCDWNVNQSISNLSYLFRLYFNNKQALVNLKIPNVTRSCCEVCQSNNLSLWY